MSDKPTLLFDVLDALEDALKHCAPDKRKALANTLDAYSEDCAEDFWWALGTIANNAPRANDSDRFGLPNE
jgi:hypothetical protein